jgi:predicted transcriptional regulator
MTERMTIMKTLSIRVPDEIEERLDEEARLAGKRKSELARDALGRFLDERERERVMAEMRRALEFLSSDPDAVAEIREISEEFAVADAESLEIAEGPGVELEKWWD